MACLEFISIPCLIALVILYSDAGKSRGIPEQGGVPMEWGEPFEGLMTGIFLESSPTGPDGPIVIHYRIKNRSCDDQVVKHSGFWPDHLIEVIAPSGKPAPLTEAGRQFREAFSPGGIREKSAYAKLAPGQVDQAWEPYNLRDLFQFEHPGVYRVRYTYQPAPKVAVRSNWLAIRVNPVSRKPG